MIHRNRKNRKGTAILLASALIMSGAGNRLGEIVAYGAPETEEGGAAGTGELANHGDSDAQGAVQAEAQDTAQDQVRITTAEEFLEFAENCVSERYSKGKTFILDADINLQDTDNFGPIPVFAGTFEGNGHGIIGFSVTGPGSNLGLFRYVQEGAVVRNLTVQGTLRPTGSRKNIGGIAGVNRGLIEQCAFKGQIMAQEAAGGIAGYNETTGIIRGCENQAALTGNLKTGGIAGYNQGLMEDCVNRGEINGTDQGVTENGDSQFSLNSMGLEDSIRVERVNDAGGIAGLSLGTVRNSSNYGNVGYPHTGYNLGGIAGRQSGLVENCQNYGQVQGRKDVGGITGQFEPYLTIKYEEDMFGSLEAQMDELSQMSDSMSQIIEEAGDTASGNLDRIDDQLGKIKDIGRFYKNIYKEGGEEFDSQVDQSLDEIQDIMDHTDLDLYSGQTQLRYRSAKDNLERMKQLRAEMLEGYGGDISDAEALRQWLSNRRQQMEELLNRAGQLNEDLEYVATHVPEEAAAGAEDFADSLDNLHVEASGLMDTIRSNADKLRNDLDSMDEELTAGFDSLSGNVDTLSGDLKDGRSQIRDQKNQIQDQIDQMRATISGGVDRAREEKDLFEDVSDLETQEPAEGMITGCINEGAVTADFQAGGIAGIIGMETSLDPEQDLEADQERTLNVTRDMRAIVSDCVNRQQIQVKNDYAGGIVGKANLGALIRNQNYGDILAEDGNYTGGITGSSAYVLRGNYNMCAITGNNYAGGIAGWGTDILDNYSMVSFGNLEGEWIGTVAGDVDPDGVVEGNFYVEEGLGAVDNVTYENQAQGLAYQDFCGQPQVPEEFGRLTVKFMVEDQVLKTVVCEYGGSVPEEEIPQVPKKDGYYYMWEEKNLSCVRGNEKVRAIYKAWNATIASSEDKMPVMLAEADFYPGTTLEARERAEEYPKERIPDGYQAVKGYEYSITQPEGAEEPESVRIHVLADGCSKQAVLGIMENGQLRVADSRRDGEYLVFSSEASGEVVILEPERNIAVWVLAAAAVLAALWLAVRKLGGRKKGKTAKAGPEQEEAGSGGPDKAEPKGGEPDTMGERAGNAAGVKPEAGKAEPGEPEAREAEPAESEAR
ncbi:MAG: hypothetical protein HFG76_15350 [Hungatella sp.]|nr:hypothetical protein [Hungatella sp.]